MIPGRFLLRLRLSPPAQVRCTLRPFLTKSIRGGAGAWDIVLYLVV